MLSHGELDSVTSIIYTKTKTCTSFVIWYWALRGILSSNVKLYKHNQHNVRSISSCTFWLNKQWNQGLFTFRVFIRCILYSFVLVFVNRYVSNKESIHVSTIHVFLLSTLCHYYKNEQGNSKRRRDRRNMRVTNDDCKYDGYRHVNVPLYVSV